MKEQALQQFWRTLRLPAALAPLVRSPLGRGYRTVTKRKAFHDRNGAVRLGLIGEADEGAPRSFEVARCMIEPAAHAAIYDSARMAIAKPFAHPLAERLQYLIVKGNMREFTVILSVSAITAPVVQAANTLSKSLTRAHPAVTGILLYEDDSGGRYYLGARRLGGEPRTRKLYGKETVYLKVLGRSFLFSPLSFSQVNESMIEPMVTAAGRLLGVQRTTLLYDLYCGYGLFSLCLAEQARMVVGVEVSPLSIRAAIANAGRQKATNVRFVRSDIVADALPGIMNRPRPDTAVLLDPPRGGAAPGVLEFIAAHGPGRVVHLFCNIDLMPRELARWQEAGYTVTQAIPFDMFPGTSSVEIMVLLERR